MVDQPDKELIEKTEREMFYTKKECTRCYGMWKSCPRCRGTGKEPRYVKPINLEELRYDPENDPKVGRNA